MMNENDPIFIAAFLCRKFEGFYPRPYLCPAGVPTIGFGTTHYEDGSRVTLHDHPITLARAEELLRYELSKIASPAVRKYCRNVDTPQRAAALIDFVYNLGAGRLQASTLRKRVNAGEWDKVPTELRKWVMGGGKRLKGLVLRREAEISIL